MEGGIKTKNCFIPDKGKLFTGFSIELIKMIYLLANKERGIAIVS